MQIVRFLSSGRPRLGLVAEGGVIDLLGAATERGMRWAEPLFSDLRLFLLAGSQGREAATLVAERSRLPRLRLEELHCLAPFEPGGKILAHVVNYRGHDRDAGVTAPSKPFFFQKPSSSVSGPGDPIIASRHSSKCDHEVELAIVIGRVARDVRPEDAYDVIGGYTVLNDVSYRDFQMNEDGPELNRSYGKNWTQAKGMDFSCPMGPVLVLTDELPRPYPLRITCRVNGRVRQDASTADMIFKAPELIAEISRGMTLFPGDVIATGAPAGGGLADGRYLSPGDLVECSIERIGVLRNPVVADLATEASHVRAT